MQTVYLCGAINGRTDAVAKAWRERTKTALAGRYHTLDPMDRDYRGKEEHNAEKIVLGDIDDITQSDIVLVMALDPSWGTAMEVLLAAQAGKRVMSVVGGNFGRCSPWLRFHSTSIHISLTEALAILRAEARIEDEDTRFRRERQRERSRAHYLKNREEVLARTRRWHKKHPERVRKMKQRYKQTTEGRRLARQAAKKARERRKAGSVAA